MKRTWNTSGIDVALQPLVNLDMSLKWPTCGMTYMAQIFYKKLGHFWQRYSTVSSNYSGCEPKRSTYEIADMAQLMLNISGTFQVKMQHN